MSGAYKPFQTRRDSGSAPRVSGAKSHIFQPPRTPNASASSSLILTRSTTSIISTTTSIANATATPRPGVSRKRTLKDYNDGPRGENVRAMEDWEAESNSEKRWMAGDSFVPASPQPFVNTRYVLAGGMDTPSLAAAQVHEYNDGGHEYREIGYRRSLSDQEDRSFLDQSRAEFPGVLEGSSYFPLDREANGRGRGYGYNGGQNAKGWSVGAVSVLGAVVGKAWEFCKAGATVFTGFRAGGGQAYVVKHFDSASHFEAAENEQNWEAERQEVYDIQRESTPVPGRFPEEDFIPDYMDSPETQSTPSRPTKRRQISGGFREDEITKNWIVVPSQVSPSTTRPQALPRPSQPVKRFTPRRSIPANIRPASRAALGPGSPKPSLLPRGSHAGSPALQANRGASFACARSPSPASRIPRASPLRELRPADESPAAKEAKKWKAVKRREEREADESIRRLDAQLKAMIREGKEALGTKFEVEVEDDFEHGDTSQRKWAY